ncbi:MAG: deoxyribonuclease IV [Methanothrix sp.]|uniref:deoxyribonuclease IV n=1 Tax=Methanothrix sp. TaxID=90426 RepID=UPI0025FD2106|nr:deoxyribonuclease IV [Methanothrix sp.]MCQ8903379.1 deoxyribonuclease IV [Methanothrix sp.]
MARFGVHISIAGGLHLSVGRAIELGCDTYQIFTSNPRGWRSKQLSDNVIEAFKSKLSGSGIWPVVGHMPYLPNLASPRENVYSRSVQALKDELMRCSALGIPYLVTHMGSHLGSGRDSGISRIVGAIEAAHSHSGGTKILLETTSGSRNSVGGRFEDLADVRERVGSDLLGICLDTCHIFAAGYDLRDEASLDETLRAFDSTVGLGNLMLIHLNDSVGDLGSGLDRHEHIGMGKIGLDGFAAVINDRRLRELPMIMETPVDDRRDDRGNLEVVRGLSRRGPS